MSDKTSDDARTASAKDLGDIALRLRLAVTRTARTLRREAGGELTPTALAALASIERHGPITPARLAEIEGVKRPTITRIAAHLTEAEMVERLPDACDGRSFGLKVTVHGEEYLAERRSRKSAYLTNMLGLLPEDEVATLSRAADILEAMEGGRRRAAGAGDP